jgi:hypothetical protein
MSTSLETRAAALVNPQSGVANDYLNHFNEILLLIENLPVLLPEMVDEMLAWKPIGYREYFSSSPLPGSKLTLEIYDTLDENFKKDFESMIELLDKIVLQSISVVIENRADDGTIDPDAIGEVCERLGANLRRVLDRTADLVNHGDAPPLERPQDMADRLLSSNSHNH